MMKKQAAKRVLALLLTVCLCVGLLPMAALATDEVGAMSAAVYTGTDEQGRFTGEISSFAADQSGLILHLDNFSATVPNGWTVSSLSFVPADSSAGGETVFWYSGSSNGNKNDKLADNGVFQVIRFAPNGGYGSPAGGEYKICAYLSDGTSEITYLSTQSFTVTAVTGAEAPTITTDTLQGGTVGTAYHQTLSATPAKGGAITWSITEGSLPGGLSLVGDSISGTPAASGSFSFTVQASEAGGSTALRPFTLVIAPQPSQTGSLTLTLTEALAINFSYVLTNEGGSEAASGIFPSTSIKSVTIPNLAPGTYTITAYTGIVGNRSLNVLLGDANPSVTLSPGGTETVSLSLKDLSAVSITPTVTAEGIGSPSQENYTLTWYYLDKGSKVPLQTNDSSSFLNLYKGDETPYYVRVTPAGDLAATHDAIERLLSTGNPNPTIELPKKRSITVSGAVSQSGTLTLYRPADTAGRVIPLVASGSSYTYSVSGVTLGSKLTFVPENPGYAPVTYVVERVTGDLTHDFTPLPARGLVSIENADRLYAAAGVAGLWNLTRVTVEQDGKAVPFRILSDRTLVLEGAQSGAFTLSAASGGTSEHPRYVYTGDFNLTGDSCTMELSVAERSFTEVYVKNLRQPTAVLIYNGNGALCGKMEQLSSSYGDLSRRSPYLPSGLYTFCTIAQSLLDSLTPAQYATLQALPAGKYLAFESYVSESPSNQVTLNAPPTESGTAAVNTAVSSLTMDAAYSDTLSIDLNVALMADADVDLTQPVTIRLFTNQEGGEDGGYGEVTTRSLTVNGVPRKLDRVENHTNGILLEDGSLTLDLSGEEVRQLGGFPLRISAVVRRSDFSRMQADAYLSYSTGMNRACTERIASFDRASALVTLQAPLTVNEKTFTVFGNAKRNTPVCIYVNGILAAETTSEPVGAGLYTAKVTLPPDAEANEVFLLTATADNVTSDAAAVVYSAAAASIKTVYFCFGTDFKGSDSAKILIWDNGAPVHSNSAYPSSSDTYVWWEIVFNNPEKLSTTVRRVNSTGTYERVPNVTVTVPLATETITILARQNDKGVFVTVPYCFPGSAGPSGTYISYYNRYEAAPEVTWSDFTLSDDEWKALLYQSGLIDYAGVALNPNNFRFTLKNDRGTTLPVHMTTTENDWDEAELAQLNSLTGERWVDGKNVSIGGGDNSVLFYQEGYLPSADGYWGAESIHRYPIADHSGAFIYVWEIYTRTERTVVTWDTLHQKKVTTVTTLGGTSEGKQVDPALSVSARTQEILDVWAAFSQQLSNALDAPATAPGTLPASSALTKRVSVTLASGNKGGNLFDTMGKVTKANSTVQTYLDNADKAISAFRDGVPLNASEMRAIKDILDQNGELVYLAKSYVDSGVEPNPYQGVVDAYNAVNGKLGDTFADYVNTSMAVGTGGTSALADAAKKNLTTGVLEGAAGSMGGQPRQADILLENLRTSMINAETGSDREMIPGGINWSRMPDDFARDRDGEEKPSEYDPEKAKEEHDKIQDAIREAKEGLEELKREKEKLEELFGHKKKTDDDSTRTTGQSGAHGGKNAQKMPSGPKALQDPSGYVYEAVPSNRVSGATVTLYTYDNAAKVANTTALGIREANPQTTGADGAYQWFVPEGYWQVRVSKDGYTPVSTGDSGDFGLHAAKELDLNGDGAAETPVGDYWMPVLPVQLDVNLPLVSLSAPAVAEVKAAEDGVYVTFSKYMRPDTVTTEQFKINGFAPASVQALNEEAASSVADAPRYASVFKLCYPAQVDSGSTAVAVHVAKAVTGYNNLTLGSDYDKTVPVASLEQLPAPLASPMAGSVQRNTLVTLESARWDGSAFVPTGATIHYTTDGSTPTADSPRYTQPIPVSGSMTIRAIALKAGMADSPVLTAGYTVWNPQSGPVTPPAPEGDSDDGSDSTPVYSVSPGSANHGSVAVSPKNAVRGDSVTLTVTPDAGYALERLLVADSSGRALALTSVGPGKFSFAMPAGNVTVTAVFAPEAAPFADVPAEAYYAQAVRWAVGQGITAGTSSGLFAPNQLCTRAQIVTFLWRAAGSPVVNTSAKFTDVPAGSYYEQAVAWAVERGVTFGIGGDRFGPDAVCTRAQAVVFLYRAAGSPESQKGTAFADVAADAYYVQAVAWAAQNGITSGIGGGLFGPDNDCTRAQIVTFLYRCMG